MKVQNPYSWELKIECGGETHRVRFSKGKLTLPDHGTFKAFKQLWSMAGGQPCGCMDAVRAYRRLTENWKNGYSYDPAVASYLNASGSAGTEAWARAAARFSARVTVERRVWKAALPGPKPAGIEHLRVRLEAKRTAALTAAVTRFNAQTAGYVRARPISLDKGDMTQVETAEIFSDLNLRGNTIGFTISLPSWAKMVRKFGHGSVNYRLVLNAQVAGFTEAGGLITRFYVLGTYGDRTPVIERIDRVTSVDPANGVCHTWQNPVTLGPLSAKLLQGVY